MAEFFFRISNRLAINLQSPRLKIDDPILGNFRRRVQARLATIQTKAGVADFDRQENCRGVIFAILTRRAGGDGNIGFRIGMIQHIERQLCSGSNDPAQKPNVENSKHAKSPIACGAPWGGI